MFNFSTIRSFEITIPTRVLLNTTHQTNQSNTTQHKMPGESGAPALDFENYKKFYGFGIPKWSPYYYVTEADDKANSESLKRFHNEGGGSLPTFKDHEELRGHLLNMSDTELNRMRDFGCKYSIA